MNIKTEIREDLERAKEALKSAERNFKEGDLLTADNRTIVACENSIYILLKLKFGSVSISRIRILTRLNEIDPKLKDLYDQSYDLRVQSDYGKEMKLLPLNRENLESVLNRVKLLVLKAEKDTSKEYKD